MTTTTTAPDGTAAPSAAQRALDLLADCHAEMAEVREYLAQLEAEARAYVAILAEDRAPSATIY